jgi:RHS repeat-associated protein
VFDAIATPTYAENKKGDKRYELANHLGNVLNVVLDRKIPVSSGGGTPTVASYTADVVSFSDYYAFGMVMPFRSGNTPEYRYGFNGMEKDDELKGETNSYDFGARMYDPRVGRWLSVDAMSFKKPSVSPYIGFADNPLLWVDPDGNDEYLSIVIIDERTNTTRTIRNHKAISENVRAGRVNEDHVSGKESQSYYDFRRIVTITIDKAGKHSMTTTYYTLYDRERFSRIFLFETISAYDKDEIIDPNATAWDLTGNGEKQKSGWSLTTKTGGASPTKTKSRTGAEEKDIEDLMTYFGKANRGASYKGEIQDIVDNLIDMSEEKQAIDDSSPSPQHNSNVVQDTVIISKPTRDQHGGMSPMTWPESREEAEKLSGKWNKTKDTLKLKSD